MKTPVLDLDSLNPSEATFKLSGRPGKILILRPWSLYVRTQMAKRYGFEGLQEIFEKTKLMEMSEIAFFMMKPESKELFKDLEDFQEAVISPADHTAMVKAILASVGIGEPEIKKIQDSLDNAEGAKEPQNPNELSPTP